jgi:methylmalonyl-CoA carboxyltransferase large subunit
VRNDTAVIDAQETTMSAPVSYELRAAIQDVRSQVARLSERVAGLEQLASMSGAESRPAESMTPVVSRAPEAPLQTSPATPTSPLAAASGITEEEVLAISAALAAWFGVHAHIRQIRLIRTGAWAQQGRVTIQASHRLYH